MSKDSPRRVAIDSAPLLPVRRLPEKLGSERNTHSESPVSARHAVLCPMLGTEVVVQRCSFCAHGSDWIHDQRSDTIQLRCSYLAQDA